MKNPTRKVSLKDGIIKQNVVLMSGLFTAPVVAASTSTINAAAICAAFSLITLFSAAICCYLPRKIVFAVKIALYAIISSVIYIPVMLLMNSIFTVDTIAAVGIYLPIIITNPLILSKTESRFSLRPFKYMLKDLIGFILGFDLACLLVGIIRDILVNNSIGYFRVSLPFTMPALSTCFGGFILVGLLAGIVRGLYNRSKNKRKVRKN